MSKDSDDLKTRRNLISNIVRRKSSIIRANLHHAHYPELLLASKKLGVAISIRDTNPFASIRLDDSQNDLSESGVTFSASGKDIKIKSKSAVDKEIAGYIPISNLLSKKPSKTKEEREYVDQKMRNFLAENASHYSSCNLEFKNSGEDFVLGFYEDNNEKGYSYCYKRKSDGMIFSDYKNPDSKINEDINFNVVEILTDGKGNKIIPDYDLAFIGHETHSNDYINHRDYGVIRRDEESVISNLEEKTNRMVRHGPDTENPVGFEFEMSEKTPYIIFTPDGEVKTASSEQEYISSVNNLRQNGFNITLNPRTGIKVDSEGNYFMPPKEERVNFKEIYESIQSIQSPEEKKEAEAIYNTYISTIKLKFRNPKSFTNEEEKAQHKQEIKDRAQALKEMRKEYLKKYGKLDFLTHKLNDLKEKRDIVISSELQNNQLRDKVASMRDSLIKNARNTSNARALASVRSMGISNKPPGRSM